VDGFARFRCAACGLDRLVAFSCKGGGFCSRCGGRRMAERAAHLVDHVFADVPLRQWVLSPPHRLCYVLAWDHDLCPNPAYRTDGARRLKHEEREESGIRAAIQREREGVRWMGPVFWL
jgi:hypothetical protein